MWIARDYNGSLKLHFDKPKRQGWIWHTDNYFGGEMQFNRQLLRDEYVRTYCHDNSIKLLEISYKSSGEEIENLIKLL